MSEADHWKRVKGIFDVAVACPAEDRSAFVSDSCGGDRALQADVESLLAADANGSMFDPPGDSALRERVFEAIADTFHDRPPVLTPGDRLGPYQIAALLGAGGMGEVYRAHDPTLGRDVALKILPHLWLADPARRARFDHEARVLASLNHPNIGAIYGVDESGPSTGSGPVKALVLELVEGETLGEHIAGHARQASRPGLPIDQVMRIASQVADALQTAHERGIVHRDLKPANITITLDGRVKVLDFGLALAGGSTGLDAHRAHSRTTTGGDTRDGVLLGTAPYMSPEQARGQPVDKRTDIWAFGCVLYEMLTGAQAFVGRSATDVLNNVIGMEPDWTALPADTPAALRLCMQRCLQKDCRQRFHDIADVRLAMEGAFDLPAANGVTYGGRPSHARLAYAGWALAFAAIAAGTGGWFIAGRSRAAPARVTRLLVGVGPADQLGGNREGRPTRASFALSPDGRTLVFSAVRANRRALYVRRFDQSEATVIAGTEDAIAPFFSPNGEWVGYSVGSELRKLPLAGGPSVHVADTMVGRVFGASWGDDDRIVFARPSGGLWDVAASGGTPTEIVAPDPSRGEVGYRLPHVLPGGDAIIFTVTRHRFPRWDQTQIRVYSRRTRRVTTLVDGGADARYVSSGHLVYVREGVLLAAPFDLRRLEVTGGSVGVIADVMQAAYDRAAMEDTGLAQFSVASTGTLVYLPGGVFAPAERSVIRVDRTGQFETLPITPRAFATLRLSPDGGQIALNTFGRDRDIWLYSLARGTLTRLPLPGRLNVPIWSRDGHWITYASSPGGPDNLYRAPADGSGLPEQLIASGQNLVPGVWSSSDELLYYRAPTGLAADGLDSLFFQNVAAYGAPTPIPTASQRSGGLDVSPDGHWIAYHSYESGQLEVYVRKHPGPGPRYQVSTEGGMSPIWRADGGELFYARRIAGRPGQEPLDVEILAVRVTTQPALAFGKPRALFKGPYQMNDPARGYDVTADGQRFVMIQGRERPPDVITQLRVVQNWHEELKRLVPTQ